MHYVLTFMHLPLWPELSSSLSCPLPRIPRYWCVSLTMLRSFSIERSPALPAVRRVWMHDAQRL